VRITGNLAATPSGRAGSVSIRPRQNTGEYRGGVPHDTPTCTSWRPAELGENAAESLHKGDAVIVVGKAPAAGDKEVANIDADTMGSTSAAPRQSPATPSRVAHRPGHRRPPLTKGEIP
jgi:single-strand DNA-binding protein